MGLSIDLPRGLSRLGREREEKGGILEDRHISPKTAGRGGGGGGGGGGDS